MGRVLTALCFRFTACCCVLPLFLALVSSVAAHAQQQRYAWPDLELSIPSDEPYWDLKSASPQRVVPFCIRNVGSARSGAGSFQVFHGQMVGTPVYEVAIPPLQPNEQKCDGPPPLQITARPEWRRKTENFLAVLVVPGVSNKTSKFSVSFPPGRPQFVDLQLEILRPETYWLHSSGEQLVISFQVTNIGNVRSQKTSVGIFVGVSTSGNLVTPGELLAEQGVGALEADESVPGAITVRVPPGISELVGIVDERRINRSDGNRRNNARWVPLPPVRRSDVSWSTPNDDSFPIVVFLTIAVIAFLIWMLVKQKEAQQMASAVRAERHLDGGTQSILLETDEAVLSELRLHPAVDGGIQWITLESADRKALEPCPR